MAAANYDSTHTSEIPECLILDSRSPKLHPDMAALLSSLEKAQSASIGKVATGLRGYNLSGFSIKVYATPINPSDGSPFNLRVQFEYDVAIKSGANYERVRAAYMDAASSGTSTKMERTRMAKPTE